MRLLPAGLATLLAVCLLGAPAGAAVLVRVMPAAPRQGDVAMVFVAGVRQPRELEGSVGGRPLHFFPYGEEWAALAGIDLETRPGKTLWRVGVVDAQGKPIRLSGPVTVRSRKFPVQRLTLPKHLVDLDPATARRAEAEAARLRTLYDTITPARLWNGRFVRPVGGDGVGEGFGSRRIINGQPRLPHSGIDFGAPNGTPVVASNRGRVVLVSDFFFGGRLVALDHGLGLYTLYMHLDGANVSEGLVVERGQIIGTVGTTGRATGPHLHFAAQQGRARIDPTGLLALPVRD
ncbi:MAG TPA: M23 family metallopeptidase [Methylomirabilota bacterium]|nr:M23 family metallopeptidase [Methylomirabilota bacterium]